MVLFFLAATIGTVSAACKDNDVQQYLSLKTKTKKSCAMPGGDSGLWSDVCAANDCPTFGKNNKQSCKKHCTENIKCNFFGGTPALGCTFYEDCETESETDVFTSTTTTYRKVCKTETGGGDDDEEADPTPSNPPTEVPPEPSVCSGPERPTGSMTKRCVKCLTLLKYTSESCEFDSSDNFCKASGMAAKAVTDPANCPVKGANKKRPGGSPTTLPEMCGGDECCVRGKAKGAAIRQSAKGVLPKVFTQDADNEYECAAACTDDCEWWTYNKTEDTCVLYKTSKKKEASAPTGNKSKNSKRYISGDSECEPMAPDRR